MKIHLKKHRLVFKRPFKIAHTTRTSTDNAYLILELNGHQGIGEAVYPPYVPETASDLERILKEIEFPDFQQPKEVVSFIKELFKTYHPYPAAMAAIDMALLDLYASIFDQSIPSILGIEPSSSEIDTSFTIGIGTESDLIESLKEHPDFNYYKLKLNAATHQNTLKWFKKHCPKTYVTDANQGFGSIQEVLELCKQLKQDGCAYLEQPFNKQDLESHGLLSQQTDLPIIADESFQTLSDLDLIEPHFGGVNVKLMKCGGLVQALEIINQARRLKLKIVLGCMSDSRVGIEAAEKIAHLADWVDLDGKYLISNNPSPDFFKEK